MFATMKRFAAGVLTMATAWLAGGCRPEPRAVIGLGYPEGLARVASLEASGTGIDIAVLPTGIRASWPWSTEVALALRLSDLPGIVGVVGHSGSRASLLAAPIYNGKRLPQIIPTGTSRRLAGAGAWTFALAPNDSIEGEFLGRFVAGRLRAASTTVFYDIDEYGSGLRDGAVRALRQRGVRILDEVPLPQSGDCLPGTATNRYAAIAEAALLQGRPDVVLLAARTLQSACIMTAIQRTHPATIFVAGDGLDATDSVFRSRVGSAADALYVAAFWHPSRPDPRSRAFVARYVASFGRAPSHEEAMIHDALRALTAAVREAGPDPEAIGRYLRSLGRTRPALPGVTGPITFPGSADRLVMTRLENSSLTVVDTP